MNERKLLLLIIIFRKIYYQNALLFCDEKFNYIFGFNAETISVHAPK